MGGDDDVVVSSRSGDRLGGRQVISSRMDLRFRGKPNQDRMSVRLCGVGKSAIALMYLLHGRTVSLVISKPANSTSSWAKRNFSG